MVSQLILYIKFAFGNPKTLKPYQNMYRLTIYQLVKNTFLLYTYRNTHVHTATSNLPLGIQNTFKPYQNMYYCCCLSKSYYWPIRKEKYYTRIKIHMRAHSYIKSLRTNINKIKTHLFPLSYTWVQTMLFFVAMFYNINFRIFVFFWHL